MLPAAPASGSTPSRQARLDFALRDLLEQAPSLAAAAVVSFDGLPMASALPETMDEGQVAAMSAALLSLGERASQGLGRGELSQVYVEGANGTVFLVSADDEAVLVAVAEPGAKVGLMLFELRHAAATIAGILRAGSSTTVYVPTPEAIEDVSASSDVARDASVEPAEPVAAAAPDMAWPVGPTGWT
jgi:predicted regulator of Ras-like GTPase activity (Roadblock/LC7/MglB family)